MSFARTLAECVATTITEILKTAEITCTHGRKFRFNVLIKKRKKVLTVGEHFHRGR